MWAESLASVCCKEQSVVAVYESFHGDLALLLRQTFMPLSEERRQWLTRTRAATATVVSGLREAGFDGRIIVLQWCPLAQVARVLHMWPCQYDADPERRGELTHVVDRHLADQKFISSRRMGTRTPSDLSVVTIDIYRDVRDALTGMPLDNWYRDMAPCWLQAEPALRRELILRIHRWIAQRALLPASVGRPVTVEDLRSDGPLTSELLKLVPRQQQTVSRSWIRLLLTDFRRAMMWSPTERGEAWARWILLIPYSIPFTGERRVQFGNGALDDNRWRGRVRPPHREPVV